MGVAGGEAPRSWSIFSDKKYYFDAEISLETENCAHKSESGLVLAQSKLCLAKVSEAEFYNRHISAYFCGPASSLRVP